ncbi:type II toxin-antitoxin system RelE/ParE family toxin [Clostridium sp.]|uniref:type II toxin-antitoxin system RelE family toxin n=1 Tax=Clostridium sp. TaxID=1506 RepID=UPI002FCB519C
MKSNYEIKLSKKAEKFIRKQAIDTQKRILKGIIELPGGDVKKLKGINEVYRLRVGDFRILFEKNDIELIIIVIDVGNRGEIYK